MAVLIMPVKTPECVFEHWQPQTPIDCRFATFQSAQSVCLISTAEAFMFMRKLCLKHVTLATTIVAVGCMEKCLHTFCLMLLTLATTELSLLWDAWKCVYTHALSYALNTGNHRTIIVVGCMEMSLHTCFVLCC